MQNSFSQFFFRNSYQLIIAAWLVTISFVIDNYWAGNSSLEAVNKKVSAYIHKQQHDYLKLLKDTATLNRLSNKNFNEAFLEKQIHKDYYFYLYQKKDSSQFTIAFWNTQVVQPSNAILLSGKNEGFAQLQNGYYVWQKSYSNNIASVLLIPVKWNYGKNYINEYLQNTFATGKDIENDYDLTLDSTNSPVKSIQGNTLFYLFQKANVVLVKNNVVAVWLRILATLVVLIFIHFCATFLAAKYKLGVAILFLSATVLVLRVASYYLPVPLNFRQFELFGPEIYGSNWVLKSLGDLLINTILFVWIILFAYRHLQEKNIQIKLRKNFERWFYLLLAVIILITVTFTIGHVIRSMVSDSQISFDVINFFTLNIYSLIGFIVLCCIAIGYFFLTQILLFLLRPLFSKNFIAVYVCAAIVGLAFLTLNLNYAAVGFELYILVWLMLYIFLINNSYFKLAAGKIISSKLIFWLFFFSISIVSIIIMENEQKELRNREHYAGLLFTKADPSSENLVKAFIDECNDDSLANNFYRFQNIETNQFLKDSIINSSLAVYNNKYDTQILTFDANEKPLFNQDSIGYGELNLILNTQSKSTSTPGLFYYDESYDKFSYINKKNIIDTDGNLLGYVFILASPKAYRTDAIYPELFSKGYNNSIENSSVYSFAIYNDLQLVNSHNDYAFPTKINARDIPTDDIALVNRNGYSELWYKAGLNKIVIIAKADNFLLESITLFSYLFCAFLVVTALFWLLNILLISRLGSTKSRYNWQMTIQNQIHVTIILICVLCFLVIGVATILFFINRYESNNKEKLSRTIHIMENEVRTSFTELAVFDNVIKVYDESYREKLEKLITKISEIHAIDVNLYDVDGNLKISSLPLPYNKGIVSSKIDPRAYYHLNHKKEVQYFAEEKIGKLSFVSNYVPVIDRFGIVYGYLNIPYFTSESKLKQEISNFLVTIINLNAFIFLIAGIVALFITNRITRSFTLIGNKMKEVNLGKHNELIEWKRKDEIGNLVKEFNKMMNKLDESAVILAKSERETAWREMARQVAHEIKNPLTPMKLSLQYLQRAIQNNAPNVKELSERVAQTLVEQIEHLNQIASEFSQFANIGNPKIEKFNLNDLLESVIQLYTTSDETEITWEILDKEIIIEADKTQMNRLFTNLLQNALQAVPENRTPLVKITSSIADNAYGLITIMDNGAGIPEEVQSKIFTPNFTTKTSGTGLGLAMCKGIVEQLKGEIWFETTYNEGTSFYVQLPIANT